MIKSRLKILMEFNFHGKVKHRKVFQYSGNFREEQTHGILFCCNDDLVFCKNIRVRFSDPGQVAVRVAVMVFKTDHFHRISHFLHLFDEMIHIGNSGKNQDGIYFFGGIKFFGQSGSGFQRAEFLLEHGSIDMVTPRNNMKKTLGDILKIFKKQDVISA